MFQQILEKLNSLLGRNYALFFEFLPQSQRAEDIEALYKNIGILNVETGSLQLLQGNKGMQVDTALNLLMAINDKDNTSDSIDSALEALIDSANGIVYEPDGTEYRYTLSFGAPTTVGETRLDTRGNAKRYYQYVLPIDVTLTQDLSFGDDIHVFLSDDNGVSWAELNGIISWVEKPTKTLQAVNNFNEDTLKNVYEVAVWEFSVSLLYMPGDALQNTLIDNERNDPNTIYSIKYGFGTEGDGNIFTQKRVYVSANQLSGQRRQFVTGAMSFSEAREND